MLLARWQIEQKQHAMRHWQLGPTRAGHSGSAGGPYMPGVRYGSVPDTAAVKRCLALAAGTVPAHWRACLMLLAAAGSGLLPALLEMGLKTHSQPRLNQVSWLLAVKPYLCPSQACPPAGDC